MASTSCWASANHSRRRSNTGELQLAGHPLAPLPVRAEQSLLCVFSGWVNRQQAQVIDYLVEENRALKEQLKGKRLHLSDNQRRRLAAKAKLLGRRVLSQMALLQGPR